MDAKPPLHTRPARAARPLDAGGFVAIQADMPPFHPFRSEAAKQAYLAHYQERAKSWPLPSEERVVPTSYGDTFVRISGPADGPPLVLLSGIGAPGYSLRDVAGPLAARFRVYAVDNVHDIGRSVNSRPLEGGADFAAWLDSLFDALELKQVNLFGLSYGGWISAQYALAHPERVRRLVLLAPVGVVAPVPFGFIWRAILTLVSKRFMANFFDWSAPEMAKDPAWADERQRWIQDATLGQASFASRRMVEPKELTDAQLASLSPPTFFLAGDREVIFDPRKGVERLQRVAPKVVTHLIPGASHDLFVVRAAEVARRTLDFLDPPAVA